MKKYVKLVIRRIMFELKNKSLKNQLTNILICIKIYLHSILIIKKIRKRKTISEFFSILTFKTVIRSVRNINLNNISIILIQDYNS